LEDSSEQIFINLALIFKIESVGNEHWILYWNEGNQVKTYRTQSKLSFPINNLFDIIK